MGAQDDGHRLWGNPLDLGRGHRAVHGRHAEVQDRHIRLELPAKADRLRPIGGGTHHRETPGSPAGTSRPPGPPRGPRRAESSEAWCGLNGQHLLAWGSASAQGFRVRGNHRHQLSAPVQARTGWRAPRQGWRFFPGFQASPSHHGHCGQRSRCASKPTPSSFTQQKIVSPCDSTVIVTRARLSVPDAVVQGFLNDPVEHGFSRHRQGGRD